MGHAGAVISGTEGTAAHKIQALEAAGVSVAALSPAAYGPRYGNASVGG